MHMAGLAVVLLLALAGFAHGLVVMPHSLNGTEDVTDALTQKQLAVLRYFANLTFLSDGAARWVHTTLSSPTPFVARVVPKWTPSWHVYIMVQRRWSHVLPTVVGKRAWVGRVHPCVPLMPLVWLLLVQVGTLGSTRRRLRHEHLLPIPNLVTCVCGGGGVAENAGVRGAVRPDRV